MYIKVCQAVVHLFFLGCVCVFFFFHCCFVFNSEKMWNVQFDLGSKGNWGSLELNNWSWLLGSLLSFAFCLQQLLIISLNYNSPPFKKKQKTVCFCWALLLSEHIFVFMFYVIKFNRHYWHCKLAWSHLACLILGLIKISLPVIVHGKYWNW